MRGVAVGRAGEGASESRVETCGRFVLFDRARDGTGGPLGQEVVAAQEVVVRLRILSRARLERDPLGGQQLAGDLDRDLARDVFLEREQVALGPVVVAAPDPKAGSGVDE